MRPLLSLVFAVGCTEKIAPGDTGPGLVGHDTGCAPEGGEVAWYIDGDGDGYGSADGQVSACDAPDGYVAAAGDCDDADPDISPAGMETCDGADEDCDGVTDDGLGGSAWYADADGDGFGADDLLTEACAQPDGYVASPDDCDDGDATVNPAGTERCGNGVDEDCDGADRGCRLEGLIGLSTSATKVKGNAEEDQFGWAMATVGDVDGDGRTNLAVSGPGHAEDAGGVWFLPWPPPTVVGDPQFSGDAPQDSAGRSLASADLDGDGEIDLVIGASTISTYATHPGGAYIFVGPLDGTPTTLADASRAIVGRSAAENAAWNIAAGGDTDGDGLTDWYVGAYAENVESGGAGALYVMSGLPAASDNLDDTADATLLGQEIEEWFGYAVTSIGDGDGDGLDDIAVAAHGNDTSGNMAGAIYVFSGPLSGTLTTADATATRLGLGASERAGADMAGNGGDVDGDGYADFLVGAQSHQGAFHASGAAYLVRGPATGTDGLGRDTTVLGEVDLEQLGQGVSIGDLDLDGYADLAIGGRGADYNGAVALFYGPVARGTLLRSDADATPVGVNRDYLSDTLLITDDLDGDLMPDLAIAAQGDDNYRGATYILSGQPE